MEATCVPIPALFLGRFLSYNYCPAPNALRIGRRQALYKKS